MEYKNKYKFADVVFVIYHNYSFFCDFAKNYLTNEKAGYSIKISEEQISTWIEMHNVDTNLYSRGYIESLVIHSQLAEILSNHNCFIFHGSSIYIDNFDNGYIFTAKSGVGKSTHVKILKQLYDDIHYVNDDKPFISYENDEFYIYGSPFDGKERKSNNVKVKLRGLFVLSRSKSNIVCVEKRSNVIKTIFEQTHISENILGKENITKLVVKMIKDIPIYRLCVNMDLDAGKTSYEIMSGVRNETKKRINNK